MWTDRPSSRRACARRRPAGRSRGLTARPERSETPVGRPIGYVQLVYGRQLQQKEDEQPTGSDPLDIASMTREQRDKLKRKLLAEHPHLAEQLGLDHTA
jgi:hypothetical protein